MQVFHVLRRTPAAPSRRVVAPGLPPRAYALYVPAAVGSRLEQLAAEKGLLVLFPNQTRPVGSSYPLAATNPELYAAAAPIAGCAYRTCSDADANGSVPATPSSTVIHGANHAYPGGDPKGTFVDPVGPDLAHAMYDFFAAHPRS